jgi:hypothetical protein
LINSGNKQLSSIGMAEIMEEGGKQDEAIQDVTI